MIIIIINHNQLKTSNQPDVIRNQMGDAKSSLGAETSGCKMLSHHFTMGIKEKLQTLTIRGRERGRKRSPSKGQGSDWHHLLASTV
jgi:hypothetical protein